MRQVSTTVETDDNLTSSIELPKFDRANPWKVSMTIAIKVLFSIFKFGIVFCGQGLDERDGDTFPLVVILMFGIERDCDT